MLFFHKMSMRMEDDVEETREESNTIHVATAMKFSLPT